MFESITMKMIRLFAVAGVLIVLVYYLTHT